VVGPIVANRSSDSPQPDRPRPTTLLPPRSSGKPEATTAVYMLLMMGKRMPETCWAVFKRRAINLRDWCIWLIDLFECMMMHGLTNPSLYLNYLDVWWRPLTKAEIRGEQWTDINVVVTGCTDLLQFIHHSGTSSIKTLHGITPLIISLLYLAGGDRRSLRNFGKFITDSKVSHFPAPSIILVLGQRQHVFRLTHTFFPDCTGTYNEILTATHKTEHCNQTTLRYIPQAGLLVITNAVRITVRIGTVGDVKRRTQFLCKPRQEMCV
jgi:hypothetical protein